MIREMSEASMPEKLSIILRIETTVLPVSLAKKLEDSTSSCLACLRMTWLLIFSLSLLEIEEVLSRPSAPLACIASK